jgi:hypothetical protein
MPTPNPVFTPLKHQTPNHNINGIAGWSNRTIYSYYGSPGIDTIPFDYFAPAGDYTTNLFEAIAGYSFPSTNSMPIYKGTTTFPARYFSTGKNIRIKGRFLISCGSTSPAFNMRVHISDPNLGLTTIAASNSGYNHTLVHDRTNMPLDYEITLTGIETLQYDTDTNTSTYETFIQANGYFQYEAGNYNSAGENSAVHYVPIYLSEPYRQTTGLITNTKSIQINFVNSADVTSLKVIYLIIEEMA